MEPQRTTASELLDIQQSLIGRETIFHRAELGRTRADFEAMMANEFGEIGASGRHYSREYVLETLAQRYSAAYDDEWKTGDFYCQEIAPANYLLTYTLWQGSRVTRRATIWRRSASGWLIVFHQGTVVEGA